MLAYLHTIPSMLEAVISVNDNF